MGLSLTMLAAKISVLAALVCVTQHVCARPSVSNFENNEVGEDIIDDITNIVNIDSKQTYTDPCNAYSSQFACLESPPQAMNCIWSLSTPGAVDSTTMSCRQLQCADMTTATNPAAQCAVFVQGNGQNCTWNSDTYTCDVTGQPPPCYTYNDQTPCEAATGITCSWNDADGLCYDSSTTPVLPCATYYDAASCATASQCTWRESNISTCASFCYPTGASVGCDTYSLHEGKIECCPTPECQWVVTGDAPDGSEGTCIPPGAVVACEQYESAAACAGPRCQWMDDAYQCIAVGHPGPCATMGIDLCINVAQCNWTGPIKDTSDGYSDDDYGAGMDGTCLPCASGASCIQGSSGGSGSGSGSGSGDSGLPCDAYTSNISYCPEPRCYADYTMTNPTTCGGGICRPSRCSDLYSAAQCDEYTGCSYDTYTGVCYNTTSAFPCDEIEDSPTCLGASHGCSWSSMATAFGAGVCYNTGQPIPCSAYNDMNASVCPTSYCHWDDALQDCLEIGYNPPCIAYGSSGLCPTSRCQVAQSICYDIGETVPCTAFCKAYECANSGNNCTWDDQSELCTTCAGGCGGPLQNCSSYATEEVCPESHCEYVSDSDVSDDDLDTPAEVGYCSPKACRDISDEGYCGVAHATQNCVWDTKDQFCYTQGLPLPCERIYSSSDCAAAECSWDSNAYICLEKNEPVPCMDYYQQPCPSNCSWNPAYDTCSLDVPSAPVTLTGTGSHSPSMCSDVTLSQLMPYLDYASEQCCKWCQEERRDRRQTGTAVSASVQCLNFVITAFTNSSLTAACPCLYRYATDINPQAAQFMKINC
eukprot:m.730287 g.730287  ORF g.730287 m.730287 type:complete len:815 (+) comp23054_c0_seq10:186-2630(+)